MKYRISISLITTIFLFTLIPSAVRAQTCAPVPTGAISWWAAENNAADRFDRNNAILNGDAAYVAGKVGQAFNFDGSGDFAQAATTSSLPVGASPRTVELWFKAPATPGESGLFQYGTASGGQMFGLVTSGNAPGRLYFYGHSADLPASTVIQPDTWYHGAVTYDGTTVKIYINGQLENSGVIGLNTVVDTNGITIGYRPGGSSWTGQIDEPTLYDRALSDTEIAAIYTAGSSGKCTPQCATMPNGTVGWWPGNDNANDIVSNNNGGLVNGVTYAPGKVDQAFSFNQANQQYVGLPVAASELLSNSAGAITVWVNPTAVVEYDMIAAFGSSNGGALGLGLNAGNVRIYHDGDPFDWQTTTAVSANTWTFLAYTWDGTTERLYKNGSLTGSRPRNFNYVPGTARIGYGFINDASVFYPGLIDELAIFNRTLDAVEIASIANAESAGICVNCVPPPSGMISWWQGDGNTNDLMGLNNGSLFNGATYAPGKVGQGFSFDGSDDYLDIPHSPSLDIGPNQPMSIKLWVKRTSAADSQIIFAKRPDCGSQVHYQLQFYAPTNLLAFNSTGATNGVFTTADKIPLNVWTLVVVTYDGANATIYINGTWVAANPMSFDRNTVPLRFGGEPSCGGQLFGGVIDDIVMFDRTLTASEVSRMYNAGSAGICSTCAAPAPNMISWWRGEDNANDATGGNYGMLLGGATFAPGRVGRAFSLNGTTAAVRIPDSPTLDVTTEFTLGAWIKPSSIPVYPNAALVISKVGPIGNLNGYQMAVANMSGTNKIWCGFNTGGNNWPQYSITGGNIPAGEWTYIACTYDHNTLAVNQNGEQVGSTAVGPVTVANTTSSLKLGSDDVAQQFYSGLIDEPMIFGRALTAIELRSFYDAGSLGVCQTASPVAPSCGAIPTGMISWWRAEGNGMDQRKADHGSLLGGTSFAAGHTGQAFNMDGSNDYVTVPAFHMGTDWTVEGWVNPAACSDNLHCPFFSRSNTNLDGMLVNYLGAGHGNYNEFALAIGNGTGSAWPLLLLSGSKYNMNAWYHVAATKNGDTYALYVNGVKKAEQTLAGLPDHYQTRDIMIGKWTYPSNTYLQGKIDEVSVYRRALSPAEMWSIYSADSFGKCVGSQTMADMDGDMWSDLSIFRPVGANGSEWWWLKSTGGNGAVQFGVATDTIMSSDFTGDGRTDVAFWRPSTGQWYILRSEDYSFYAFPFGSTGDIPVAADFDGDGKADPTVYRPSTTTWYINKSTGGAGIAVFGAAGDKPVPEDYDGDGKADIAVFRPNGTGGAEWWITLSSGGVFATQFGQPTDKAVPADYTGDGKADIAFWTPSNGYWYILRSDDYSYYAFPFGGSGDLPVPADYDGDSKADPGVYRPSNSNWYLNRSTAGILIQQFGQTGDVPVPNAFVR